MNISDTVTRKFVDLVSVSNIEIETDTGWHPISGIGKTIPYDGYKIVAGGATLKCADTHILFRSNMTEVFAKDLEVGDEIMADTGPVVVTEVTNLNEQVEMFDVSVDSPDHRYYSNGLLSHNTTIINALCYALYNKAFDAISLQKLINTTNASKNTLMEVRLSFTKGTDDYEIYRARGEEYRIEIKRNGEDITPGKGVIECDNIILDIIGISYDLFTKTVIFSGNSPAFLQLPISQQRNQIEELFNITLMSERAVLLKDKIRTTEQDIKIAEAVIAQQQVAVDLHAKHVREAEQRVAKWEQTRATDLARTESVLADLASTDFESEKILHAEKTTISADVQSITAKLGPLRKDRQHLTNAVDKLMKEHEHLVVAKCPYCTQSFADAPAKISAIDVELEDKGAKLLEIEDSVGTLELELSALKNRLAEVNSNIKHQNLEVLLSERANAANLKAKLEDLKVAENPHHDALARLKEEKVDAPDLSKIDNLKRRLDHQQFLLKLLTDKNSFLRRRIINRTIPFLNARINYYTVALGLPHIVKFDADMSCTVAEFGRELDFGNLSAGEKKRVNTALALAFRDVLHHLHAKINLLMIDEIDGALDAPGLDNVVKIVKEKSRDEGMSVFVISHHPSVTGRLDKNLRVIKEQGFSRIEMELT
jgi:DNA repair exonuclease SbcCD ATPase subunit